MKKSQKDCVFICFLGLVINIRRRLLSVFDHRLTVFRRRQTEFLTKAACKILPIGKAKHIRQVRYRHISRNHQLARLLEPLFPHIIHRSHEVAVAEHANAVVWADKAAMRDVLEPNVAHQIVVDEIAYPFGKVE